MDQRKLWMAFWLVTFTLSMAYAADLPGGGQHSKPSQGHKNVIGTVTKATEAMIFLETEDGVTRTFAIKEAEKEGIRKCKPGERVLLELDEGNQIIDIVDIGEKHQLVHGEVVGIDGVKKVVTLKLKDGTSQSYKMKEAVAGKMNNIKIGTAVTIMIDSHNKYVMDVDVE